MHGGYFVHTSRNSMVVLFHTLRNSKISFSSPATFPRHRFALKSNMQQTWVSHCSYHPRVLFLVLLSKFKKFFFLFIYVNSLGGSHSLCFPGVFVPIVL